MKGILIKSAAALALCVAPGIAWAQSDATTPKPPLQTQEDQGQGASPDGSATGQSAPSGSTSSTPSESSGSSSASGTDGGTQDGSQPTTGEQSQGGPQSEGQDGAAGTTQGGSESTTGQQPQTDTESGEQGGSSTGQGTTEGGSTPQQPDQGTTSTQEDTSGADVQVNVTSEQQTEIKQVITETKIEPVPSVDFSVEVGTAVPQTITLHPLPPRIIELVPDYEGYVYFVLADGRIIIVDPDTDEIVLIIV